MPFKRVERPALVTPTIVHEVLMANDAVFVEGKRNEQPVLGRPHVERFASASSAGIYC